MKKIVSFDLDGTLVHGKYGDLVWNQGIPEEYAGKHGIRVEEAKRLIRAQYEAVGEADIDWYNIDHWLRKFDLAVEAHTLLDRFESFIEIFPDAVEVLDSLAAQYTLVIASNAARIFVEKELGYTDLNRYFSHVVSATTDFGMVKKGEGFYERLCTGLNVSPREVVHVGDHRIFDFEAPRRLGIEAYHVAYDQPPSSGSAQSGNGYVISRLKELLDRI